MKRITLFILFLSTLWGYSQVHGYTFTQTNGTYTELSGVTTSLGDTTTDNQFIVDPAFPLGGTPATGVGFPIGFNFIFNGYTYDRFAVNPNGWISLGSSLLTTPVYVNATVASSPMFTVNAVTPEAISAKIIPFAKDMQAQAGASIQFQTSGTPGHQVLVIQWKNYRRSGVTGDSFNFQIRLTEATNTVDFVYGPFTSTAISHTSQVGLRAEPSTAATNFINRTSTTGWDNTTPGTASANTVTMTDVIKPASGLTYTWTPGTCSEPKSLVTSNITDTGATLGWGSYSYMPTPNSYEYICSTAATLPTVAGTPVSDITATATGLSQNTTYNVFLRSVCGTQFSQWINVGTFKTKCSDAAAFTENFDSYTTTGTGTMPNCWVAAGTGTTNMTTGGASPGTAPNRLYMTATGSGTTPTVAYAILPPVTNLKAGINRLKFKVYATTASRTFDVGYFTDVVNLTGFTSIGLPTSIGQPINLPSTAAANAQEFIVVPPTTIPDGVKNLVFRNAGTGTTAGTTTLYIDDVIWQVNPACTDVKNVVVKSPTSTSVSLSWDVTGTETAWQYAASASTVTDPTTLPAASFVDIDVSAVTTTGATRTFMPNNLTPNTSYIIWVRSKCGDGAYGYWSASPTFLTTCAPVSTFVESFDTTASMPDPGVLPSCWTKVGTQGVGKVAAYVGQPNANLLVLNSTSTTTRAVVAMPPLSNAAAGTYRLRFKIRGSVSSVPYEVGYLTDITNDASFVSLTQTQNLKTGLLTDYNTTVILTFGTAPLSQVLAFRNSGAISGGSSIYIDDVSWEPVSTCADAGSLVAKLPTSTSVQLSWNVIGTETAWQYAVSPSTVTDPATLPSSAIIDVDPSSVTVSGVNRTMPVNNLTAETSYKIWIRSNCGTGGYGNWASTQSFLMPCAPVATIFEDFDVNLTVPGCWKKIEAAGTISVVANQGSASSNALQLTAPSSSLAAFTAFPPLSTATTGGYRIKFKAKTLTAGSILKIIGYTDLLYSANAGTAYATLKSITLTNANTDYYVSQVFTAAQITTPYLGFWYNSGSGAATVYIDDFVWEFVPACPDVTAVTINGITTNSVDLGWTGSGTENAWQYAITSTQAADPNTLAVDFVNPSPMGSNVMNATISNLTPSTSYKYWIRSNCGSGSFGAWVGPYYFTTNCTGIDGFVQNFDASTNFPSCWYIVGATVASVTAQTGTSSPNILKIGGSTSAQGVVAMQPLTNSAAGTNLLRFRLSGSVAGAKVEVGYTTNVCDPAKFVSLNKVFTVGSTTAFSSEFVDLGTSPLSQILAFRNPGTSTTANTVYIDDVVWEPKPPCADVVNVLAKLPTGTSVNLSWDVSGTETTWQYSVSASTVTDAATLPAASFVDVDVSAVTSTGATRTFVVNNLTPLTSYKIWVRAKCDAGNFGHWSASPIFTTTCASVATITENFDTTADGALPSCWTKVGTQGIGKAAIYPGAPSGPNLLVINSASATTRAVVAMPPLSNAAAGTYRLRFRIRGSVSNVPYEVGYVTDITNDASFVPLTQNLTTGLLTDYNTTVVLTLGTAPLSQVLAFRNSGLITNGSSIYIDDVSWEPITTCADAGSVAAKLPIDTSVQLAWNVIGTETTWQYAVSSSTVTDPSTLPSSAIIDIDPNSVTATGANRTMTVNNLTPDTSYKIWIRSKCGTGNYGYWASSQSFLMPACSPVATIFEDFDTNLTMPNCWRKIETAGTISVVANQGSASSNALQLTAPSSSLAVFTAFPPLSTAMTGGYRIKFKAKTLTAGSILKIICYTDLLYSANANTVYTTLKSITLTNANTDYYVSQVFTAAQITSPYLGFWYNYGSGAATAYIDDFVWEFVPACPDVTAVTINGITGNSVDLGWTGSGTENAWQYAITNTTVADPNTLAVDFASPFVNGLNATATVSNLTPSTSYKYWIRSNCGSGSFGAWVGPYYFTTNCAAIDGFTQYFDASTNFPACWSKVGSANAVVTNTPTGASSPNVLQIDGNTTGTATKGVVAMQPVNFTGDGTNILRFKLSGSIVGAKLEVGYIMNPLDASTFHSLKTYTVGSTTAFSTEAADLGYDPASQVLAFRNPGTSTANSSVYIDDVVWEPLPDCLDISTPVSTGITSTTIGLTWKKGGTEGSWQYAIGDSSLSDTKTLSIVNIVSPTIKDLDVSTTISGLTPATSYKVWVRPSCSATSSGVWKPYVFTTYCAPVDNFTEKFDVNTSVPACWTKVGTAGTVSVTAIAGASAPNALTLISTTTAQPIVAMPPVTNAGTGTYRLRFKFRSSTAGASINVGYLTNIADPTSFVVQYSIPAVAKDVFYSQSVNMGTNPTSELLAFKNANASATTIYVDDVIWEPLPVCPDLSALAPISAAANSASLGWTAGGSETAWQYAVSTTASVDPSTLAVDFVAPTVTGTNVVGTIGNLNPSTSYTAWVRAKCSDTSFGIWTDPVTFTTSCVTTDLITQNFDASTSLPACWSKVGANGTVSVGAYTGTPSGTNALYLYAASASTRPTVAMPPLSNAAAGTHRLKFKFKCGGVGQTIEVGYLKIVTDPNSFVSLKSFTSTTNTVYESATAVLGTTPLSQVLAFRNAGSTTLAVSFYVDNVVWEPIPACPDITGLAISGVGSPTTNVKWTAGGTETAWQYVLGKPTDTDPTSLTPVVDFVAPVTPVAPATSVSGIVNNLTPSTSYKVWVRANCGSNSFGAWTEVPLSFTTPCASVTAFTENFDTTTAETLTSCWTKVGTLGLGKVSFVAGAPSGPNLLVINSQSTTARAVVAMPPVSNAAAGTYRLRFKARGSANSVPFEVGYVTDITNDASFVSLYSFTTGLATDYNVTTAAFGTTPANTPLSQILAFRNSGTIASSVYIDDVIWEPIPTCADVKTLTSNTTSNSATITWTAGGTETAWQYVQGDSTVTDPNSLTPVDVTSTTLTLSNLPSSTSFKVWVRSMCDANTPGAWIGLTVTTPCPFVATLSENFDASANVPNCWNKLTSNGTLSVAATKGTNSSNALKLVSQGAGAAIWVGLPPLSTASAPGYRLKFNYNSDTAGIVFQIATLQDPSTIVVGSGTTPSNFTVLATPTATAANTQYSFNSVVTGTSPFLGFRVYGTSGVVTVYIDDVVWEPLPPPTCAASVTATPDAKCGTYGTVISWPATTNAVGYKLTVGTTSGGSDLINNKDLGNVLTYSVVGVPNTTYYYTLKPYTSSDATGCTEQTFVTNANSCYCISAPTTKDGTGITNVQIGGSKFVNPSVTYSDFTAKTVNVAQGVNTVMNITYNTGVFAYNTNVWVDFNDNKLFETSEIVFTGKSANTSPNTLNASFVLQPTATLGMHRMRIGAAVALQTPANPCYSGTLGVTLDFTVNIVSPIVNDEPAGATALTVGTDFSSNAVDGTNINATSSAGQTDPTCGGYNGSDVWYTATVPASGNVTFEVNSVTNGITNTAAAAYSGTPAALTLISCDDSSSTTGKNIAGGDQPKIALTGRTAGEVLYFRVWENGGDAFGNYKVSAYKSANSILGLDTFDLSNFSFHPNPVKDVLNISLDKEITDVTIFNLLGQQVFAKSVNSNQLKIDMSGLTIGTYLVKVTADNQSKTIKVVKE